MRLMVLAITNKFRLFSGVLFALILCQSSLFAQISAPTASYSSATEYTLGGVQNEIFVFCDEAGVNMGELKAVSPDAASGWSFVWTKWDSGTNTFGAPIQSDNGQESIISGLDDGLYHVKLEKGTEVRDYQAWVINHLKNTNQPSFSKTDMDCLGVYFTSSFKPKVYQYSDYPSANLLDVPVKLNFKLEGGSSNEKSVIKDNYNGEVVNISDDYSFKGMSAFSLVVIDECGFEYSSDLIESETYVVEATFNFDPEAGEAPLEVNFEPNENPDGVEYEWYLYKESKHLTGVDYKEPAERDDLLTDIITEGEMVYTYMYPGEYMVKLIVKNNLDGMSCIKSSEPEKIIVEGSIFEVPNVFTPNGDGANDVFRIRLFSVKSYNAKIFNRWGRLVCQFEESDIQYTNAGHDPDIVGDGSEHWKSVKGWDGKINGKLATPGTYFYVVEAKGREEEGKHYTEKGSLTLLHNK